MIEPISPINSRILSNRIQEDPQVDPQEAVGMTPIEGEVEMIVDHTIVTEGEIGEIAIHQILL